MKKLFYFSVGFIMAINIANANIVSFDNAQAVAANFYKQNAKKQAANPALAYTETSTAGDPIYYVFNMNDKEGFVIVSAEDAGHPIIGYSTEGNYVIPDATSNPDFNYWMQQRKKEITEMRIRNVQSTLEIKNEWANYLNTKAGVPQTMSGVAPLVQSKWNQSGGGNPSYNSLCPGGSVTGCCATAMAQIMRFWSYPASGTGLSSYCDCSATSSIYTNNYGTLSVNYANETYNWSAMSLNSSSAGAAQIAYDCGVSMEMDYSPSGSGAEVITDDYPACTQTSLVKYFGYDPTTIQGLRRTNYTDTAWVLLLDNEFNHGRPVNYVGFDPASGEGHSWVCDGYDASNHFHMNWGWGGFDDGFFSINNLQTTNGNFKPSAEHEAIIGIQPPPQPTIVLDAGTFAVYSPSGLYCSPAIFAPQVIIRNFGSDTLKSCTITYNLDGSGNQTYNWTGVLSFYQSALITLPTMTVSIAGTHIFTSVTGLPNSLADGNPVNDTLRTTINVMSNTASQQTPYVQGFESTGFPYTDCYLTSQNGPQWTRVTTASYTGSSSMELDNYSAITGDVDEFITPSIDLSNATGQYMTFELAHTQLDSVDTNNQLNVLASTDCGTTWIQLYSKTDPALATAGIVSSVFTPSSQNQWRKETVSIATVMGQADVRFKFQFNSYPFFDGMFIYERGNNIYIDDINIAALTGVAEEYDNDFNLSVFPNPFGENATISFNILEKNNISISVYDVIGKKILAVSAKTELRAGTYTLPLNRNDLKSGIYFVKLNVGDYSVTKKMVVQ